MNPKKSLTLSLFSGFHDPNLDIQFQEAFRSRVEQLAQDSPYVVNIQIYQIGDVSWLQESPAIGLYIGFSAGGIPAAIAAYQAKLRGQRVLGLILIDGWGIPAFSCEPPTYRFSHDLFTHTTSPLIGGRGVFFADPPTSHLFLWSKPDRVRGWYLPSTGADPIETTAIEAHMQVIQSLIFARHN